MSDNQTEFQSKLTESVWLDKVINFDLQADKLKLLQGENLFMELDHVQDLKGNPDSQGSLKFTSHRVIWKNNQDEKFNLSIGYDCISKPEIGATIAFQTPMKTLLLKCKHNALRQEFIFGLTDRAANNFEQLKRLIERQESTRVFRDLRVRSQVVKENNLIMLEDENVQMKEQGVWNVGIEKGNVGNMYLTNVRIVWFREMSVNLNVSIPWIQIEKITVARHQMGSIIEIQTNEQSGNQSIGFYLKNLREVLTQMTKLLDIFTTTPVQGMKLEKIDNKKDNFKEMQQQDDDVIEDQITYNEIGMRAQMKGSDEVGTLDNVEYCEQLGLSIIKPPNKLKISDLWKVF